MAKTTLRAYNREIETLIEQNQFEQAIAHARHILKFFPKHIHTYRLLGKAYLESQRYGDAADVFQRVLSAVPDDFVSHVGMSIIREDEGNLDEAIWHMERAFEVQPANSAIQGELRRLYGRRDGMEPPKVRLTRGALARMYLKGELYQQAIAELRAALAEDPQRPDLLSLLAQAYFLTGQRVEAADTCSALLKKTPYSHEANRILAEILSSTERAEEAQAYQQRVQALDPYAAHTSPAAPAPERVSDTAVSLEKLVWSPGQPVSGAPGQPEWATSLGVNIGATAPSKEALPDWLTEQPEMPPAVTPESEAAVGVPPFEPPTPAVEIPLTPPEEEEAIPDWMKEAGWQPAAAGEEEPAASLPEAESLVPPPDELAPAEIPDWLQAMAPGEIPEAGGAPEEPGEVLPPAEPLVSDSDALSWLQETPPGPTDSVATWLEEKQPPVPPGPSPEAGAEEATGMPEWLKGLGAEEPAKPAEPEMEAQPPTEVEAEAAPEEAASLPDWLEGGAVAAAAAGAATAEELPDWLKETGEKAGTEAEAEPGTGLPDWLREVAPTEWEHAEKAEAAPPEVPAAPQAEKTPAQAEDEAFAWLESLAAKQGAEEALILEPEERRETPPDWVVEATSKAEVEPTPPVSEEPALPEWPPAEAPQEIFAEEVPAAAPAEEIPEWLRGLEGPAETKPGEEAEPAPLPPFAEMAEEPEAPGEAIPEPGTWQPEGQLEAPPVEPPAEPAELPDWLKGIAPEPGAEAFAEPEAGLEAETPLPVEEGFEVGELPVWLSAFERQHEIEPELEMLFGPQVMAVPIEEPPPSEGEPAVISDTQPTRVHPPEEPSAPLEEAELPPAQVPSEEIPEWLRGLGEEQPAPEVSFEAPSEGLSPLEPAEEPALEALEGVSIEAPSETGVEPPSLSQDDEAAFAWLESLAARMGAQEALLLTPEDRLETPPEWVQKASEEETAALPVEEAEIAPSIETVPLEEIPPEEPPAEGFVPEVEVPVEITPMEEVTKELVPPQETALPEAEPGLFEPVAPMEIQPEVQEARPELPSWLTDVEQAEMVEEEPAWTPPPEAQPEAVAGPVEVPSVVEPFQPIEPAAPTLDLNQAGLAELERVPGVGYTRALAVITYRQAFGPFGSVDELVNIAGFDQALVDTLKERIGIGEAQPVEAVGEAMDIYQVTLIQARNALIQGNTPQALAHYSNLIKASQFIPDMIQDLSEALYRFPVDISIWEALGDAHVRNGHLQDALDAYTKAEELIR